MRRSADFDAAVRSGVRARRGRVVVHHLGDDAGGEVMSRPAGAAVPIVGLVVGKVVGNSVVRHRVSRRLRAQLAGRLALLPGGSRTVIRALPGSADATSCELAADLDAAFARLGRR